MRRKNKSSEKTLTQKFLESGKYKILIDDFGLL